MRITQLETLLVQPRWLFLKIHTDEGLIGWGEPSLENRAETVATAIREVEPYLLGKDPTRVMHHWQAIYKHAFYRGGPVLTSALSGIEHALWDITGKALGVPIYQLFGGPLRDRIKVYAHVRGSTLDERIAHAKASVADGFIALKTGVFGGERPARIIETPAFIDRVVHAFAALREAVGREVDIAIDFHGAISPQTAMVLIKALEPYQPMFIEEPVQCQNVDVLADIARKTHLPIATGERLFTKWGFREVLEKKAAVILQPDISHAGGIFEGRLIAGMAESVLCRSCAALPARADFAGGGDSIRCIDPQFLGARAGLAGRGLPQTALCGQGWLCGAAHRSRLGHRDRRGVSRYQARPQLASPRPFPSRRRRCH